MVEHKSSGKMICHYCGFSSSKHSKCPTCGSDKKMMSLGPGVERIEEEVKRCIPTARTIIFASDNIENHEDAADVINIVASHQVDIVIGTQMVAKGLHFPKLNLVGVIESDKNLIGGDIRTYERTYQLLHQVAGRAGREEDRGLVLIQTYNPNNRILNNLTIDKRDEFYQAELSDRKEANMPPFSRLAIISIQSLQEKKCIDFSYLLLENAPLSDRVEVLGPMPAPLFILRKQYRYRFIVKAEKSVNLQKFIKDWTSPFPTPSGVKIKIDIDPYNFL
jgi:primosomal protein N' (replication factor Y)